MNDIPPQLARTLSRRQMFQNVGAGIGGMALGSLLEQDGFGKASASSGVLGSNGLHFPSRAKNVIYVHMVGAPSHLDLFDYKPELQKRNGELCPDYMFKGKQLAFIRKQPTLMGTPKTDKFAFSRCGKSGLAISNLLPHLQTVADDICFIRSLHTDQFNHAPAQMLLLTGFEQFGRPSVGSWTSYGLGSENRNLPNFVVLVTGQVLGAGNSAWGSGFLPTIHQGIEFRSQGDPVLFLSNPPGVDSAARRSFLDDLAKLNQLTREESGDPETSTRISQYEMAYRMQTSVPELSDLSDEPEATFERYGPDSKRPGSFARNCLLARRLAERDVRFIQLFHRGWDQHTRLPSGIANQSRDVDQAQAALVMDLKERGLLDDTLVVWGGEFGRSVYCQGKFTEEVYGRDHHPRCFTIWMAGGGVKPGISFGETDEFSYNVVKDPVHVHDLHATIMHLMGIDHTRLTYHYQGRDFRLTDVHGKVVNGIVA